MNVSSTRYSPSSSLRSGAYHLPPISTTHFHDLVPGTGMAASVPQPVARPQRTPSTTPPNPSGTRGGGNTVRNASSQPPTARAKAPHRPPKSTSPEQVSMNTSSTSNNNHYHHHHSHPMNGSGVVLPVSPPAALPLHPSPAAAHRLEAKRSTSSNSNSFQRSGSESKRTSSHHHHHHHGTQHRSRNSNSQSRSCNHPSRHSNSPSGASSSATSEKLRTSARQSLSTMQNSGATAYPPPPSRRVPRNSHQNAPGNSHSGGGGGGGRGGASGNASKSGHQLEIRTGRSASSSALSLSSNDVTPLNSAHSTSFQTASQRTHSDEHVQQHVQLNAANEKPAVNAVNAHHDKSLKQQHQQQGEQASNGSGQRAAQTRSSAQSYNIERAPSLTAPSVSQFKAPDDTAVTKLLRAFLAEHQNSANASPTSRRESLPLSAFTTPSADMSTDKTTKKTKKDHDVTERASANTLENTAAYKGLTEQEMQELYVVLRDLSAFMPPPPPAAAAQPQPQQQHRPSPPSSARTPTPPPEHTEQPFTDPEEEAAAEKPFGHYDTPLPSGHDEDDDDEQEHEATPEVDFAFGDKSCNADPREATAAPSKLTVTFEDDASPHHRQHSFSRKQSVEGRYKEALKTIEEAASDCEVALKRVEDYSASLYILVETWMHLHDNRFDEFAVAVLKKLLDDHPEYAVLFYTTDIPTQALVIMDMIGRAVVAFTRPADLMDIMGEMGARHNLYGLREDQFMAMRTAFLQVYGEFVGPETYAKSVGVWKMFWKTTIELALSGASSERGEIYTQRRNIVWAERVQKVMKQLIPRQRSGGFHRLLQNMYKRAVALHPELRVFERFSDLRTAHRSMEALIRITKCVTDGGTPPAIVFSEQFNIQTLFTEPGADFTVDVMQKLETPFLDACEFFMKQSNTWNVVMRAALQELWSIYVTGYWTVQPASGNEKGSGATAPDGKEPFCLMFTDVEASTRLWDTDTQVMGTAMRQHHKLIRSLIEDFGGYEVKTVGDSFLIATTTVTQALLIAFGIQLELMTEPSAPNFRMVDSPQGSGDASCWRDDALRVRVGIHYCTDANAVYDSVHGRFDYYGPSVNCASRVESAACGGQVLLSEDAYARLQLEESYDKVPVSSLYVDQLGKFVQAQQERGIVVTDRQLTWFSAAVKKEELGTESISDDTKRSVGAVTTMKALTRVTDEGLHPLKGIAEPVRLFSLMPVGLDGRRFHKEQALLGSSTSKVNLLGQSQFDDFDGFPSVMGDALCSSSVLNSSAHARQSTNSSEKMVLTPISDTLDVGTS